MKHTIRTIGMVAILAGGLVGFSGSAIAQMDPDRGDGFDFDRAGPGYGGFYNESQRNSGGGGSNTESSSQRTVRITTNQRATAALRYAELKEKLGASHPDLQRAGTLMQLEERERESARTARQTSDNDKADSAEARASSYFSSANRILEGLY